MLGGCRVHILRRDFQFFQQSKFKTLYFFVSNSKRLEGYTQRVRYARHVKDFFKTGQLQGFTSKEPGTTLIH
jgi:hypothetical protein